MHKHYTVNFMSMPYTTTIIPLLYLVAGFDRDKVKDIEKRLIESLESVGCSESRYRRFKTDQEHSTPLKYMEVKAIYDFFLAEMSRAIQAEADQRMKETLRLWIPAKEEDVYLVSAQLMKA